MKVLIDTNVLVSALFYPGSVPARTTLHVAENHDLVLTDYNISELRKVAREKFPDKLADIDLFLAELSYELIQDGKTSDKLISDPKDVPILSAALQNGV